MKRLFKRHRIRATFYHGAAIMFILSTLLYAVGFISTGWSYFIAAALFVIDYVAEMYDPHPDNPGPWFKAHFHRFFEDDNEDE